MTTPSFTKFIIGLGLFTFPGLALAQAADSATPATSATPQDGQVSATGWTTGTDQPPTAAGSQPTAQPSASPAPSPATSAPATPAPANAAVAQAPAASSQPSEKPVSDRDADAPAALFGSKTPPLGGYGALSVRYAHLAHEDGALTGLEGALLLDHRFALGLAGYAWANDQRVDSLQGLDRPYLRFGYGGFLMRYHQFIPETPVCISVATLIGGGAVGLSEDRDSEIYRRNSDVFFIFEPQLGAYVNLTRWMRIGVDAGYRVVSGVSKFGYSNSDFGGASVGGNIGFGWF